MAPISALLPNRSSWNPIKAGCMDEPPTNSSKNETLAYFNCVTDETRKTGCFLKLERLSMRLFKMWDRETVRPGPL